MFIDIENPQNIAGGLKSVLSAHQSQQTSQGIDAMSVQRPAMVQRVDSPQNQRDWFPVEFCGKRAGRARQTVLPVGLGRQQAGFLVVLGVPHAAHHVD